MLSMCQCSDLPKSISPLYQDICPPQVLCSSTLLSQCHSPGQKQIKINRNHTLLLLLPVIYNAKLGLLIPVFKVPSSSPDWFKSAYFTPLSCTKHPFQPYSIHCHANTSYHIHCHPHIYAPIFPPTLKILILIWWVHLR